MFKQSLGNLLSDLSKPKLDLDDPETTALHRKIINKNIFLHRIYEEWYLQIKLAIPPGDGRILELGSGGGFLEQFIPELITSEIFYVPHVRSVLDGMKLPLKKNSLLSIVMVNVLHHISHPSIFLKEASRCIKADGALIMIEPWVTSWSKIIYHNFHHEPFLPMALNWEFNSSGPLSGANGAIPWIIFKRDLKVFEQEFPEWEIRKILPFMPFRYLLAGGVSRQSLMPGWSFNFWKKLSPSLIIGCLH